MRRATESVLKNLTVFVQAAEALSFALAAERLGLSRSAVGKSIARLEEQLQVRLFNRTTRSLSLTEAGRLLFERAQDVLGELEAVTDQLAYQRQVPSGRLRIDLPIVFGREAVVPILLDVAKKYPQITLDVSFNNRYVDLIAEGVDLAVRMGELDNNSELIASKLGEQKLVLCGSRDYFAQHGKPHTVAELDEHACITYTVAGRPRPWRFKRTDGSMFTKVFYGPMRFESGDVILDAVLRGFGVAQLPTWLVARQLREGDLEIGLADYSVHAIPVHLLWPRVKTLSPKTRVVVDELKRRLVINPALSAG